MRYGWPIRDATPSKRPRAARYPFTANVVLFDLDSGRKTPRAARTSDLSVFGCLVVLEGASPIATGVRVRLQMTYMREVFEAVGRVVHSRPVKGVGISFTKVEHHHQLVLEKWLTELRSRKFRKNGTQRPAFLRPTSPKRRLAIRTIYT